MFTNPALALLFPSVSVFKHFFYRPQHSFPHIFFSLITLPFLYIPLLWLLTISRPLSFAYYLSSFSLLPYLISLLSSYSLHAHHSVSPAPLLLITPSSPPVLLLSLRSSFPSTHTLCPIFLFLCQNQSNSIQTHR